jgi:hypothetical protein
VPVDVLLLGVEPSDHHRERWLRQPLRDSRPPSFRAGLACADNIITMPSSPGRGGYGDTPPWDSTHARTHARARARTRARTGLVHPSRAGDLDRPQQRLLGSPRARGRQQLERERGRRLLAAGTLHLRLVLPQAGPRPGELVPAAAHRRQPPTPVAAGVELVLIRRPPSIGRHRAHPGIMVGGLATISAPPYHRREHRPGRPLSCAACRAAKGLPLCQRYGATATATPLRRRLLLLHGSVGWRILLTALLPDFQITALGQTGARYESRSGPMRRRARRTRPRRAFKKPKTKKLAGDRPPCCPPASAQ